MESLFQKIRAERWQLLGGMIIVIGIISGMVWLLQRSHHQQFILSFNGQDTSAEQRDIFITQDSLTTQALSEAQSDDQGAFRIWSDVIAQLAFRPDDYLPAVSRLTVTLTTATDRTITARIPCRSCSDAPPVLPVVLDYWDRLTLHQALPDQAQLYTTTALPESTVAGSTLESWLLSAVSDRAVLITPEIWRQLRLSQLATPTTAVATDTMTSYPGAFELPQIFYIQAADTLHIQGTIVTDDPVIEGVTIYVRDLDHQIIGSTTVALDPTGSLDIDRSINLPAAGVYELAIEASDDSPLRIIHLNLNTPQFVFDKARFHNQSKLTCRLDHPGKVLINPTESKRGGIEIASTGDPLQQTVPTALTDVKVLTAVDLPAGTSTIEAPGAMQIEGAYCTTVPTSGFQPFVRDIISSGQRDTVITRATFTQLSNDMIEATTFYRAADLRGLAQADTDYLHQLFLRLRQTRARALGESASAPQTKLYQLQLSY